MFLNVATAAPLANAAAITGAGLPAGTLYNGTEINTGLNSFFPVGLKPGRRAQTHVAPNFHNPYAEQFSFGVERQVTSHIAAEVRYVGNHTVGNFQSVNANPDVAALAADFPNLVPAGVTPCTTPAPGVPNSVGRADCSLSRVRERLNTAFSIYNGLQTRLDFQNW